jgi:hypothetical protein
VTKPWTLHLSIAILIVALISGCGAGGPTAIPAIGVASPAAATEPVAQATVMPSVATPAGTQATATPLPEPSPTRVSAVTPAEPPTATAGTTAVPAADPFDLLSLDSLFGFLDDLTAIQPYSGWRNSATEGEAQALDYVATTLGGFSHLQDLGLELERQQFHVYLATELWETRLELTIDGQQVEVPADGARGPRDIASQARRFDSDGVLNDAQRDPVIAAGGVVAVRTAAEIEGLTREQLQDKIVFLDYAVVDRSLIDTQVAVQRAWTLLDRQPAGLVLVTQFSNALGESHGAFVADSSAFDWVEAPPAPPLLYVRLEDLAAAGITGWDGLARVESARLTWDADVFLPGTSGNLVARIPGQDPSRAVILGAHIDSPNVPGAMDDGSGSAILLEVARVLDAAHVQPPVDLYLAWFGSEELGLYGASHFVATHQELLDRTLAMLQIDCLTRPLDGVYAEVKVVTWPYDRQGRPGMPWPEYLQDQAEGLGLEATAEGLFYAYSDNTPFGSFDVPNADLIFEPLVGPSQSVHAAGHIHDPYDTVELARDVGEPFETMARLALVAALETGRDHDSLRLTPPSAGRAVFVASHTEAVHMGPATTLELGAALAVRGLDVDLVPYGQLVTAADLAGAKLVVALPVLDYPGPAGGGEPYDEAWTTEEVAVLEEYVAGGGLLVVANSANRLKYGTGGLDPNEDWPDVNALAGAFGLSYIDGVWRYAQVGVQGDHPLVAGLYNLEMGDGNGIPFELDADAQAQVLAQIDGEPVVALLDHGPGQVLALADIGILTSGWDEPRNLVFWQNLARYALER